MRPRHYVAVGRPCMHSFGLRQLSMDPLSPFQEGSSMHVVTSHEKSPPHDASCAALTDHSRSVQTATTRPISGERARIAFFDDRVPCAAPIALPTLCHEHLGFSAAYAPRPDDHAYVSACARGDSFEIISPSIARGMSFRIRRWQNLP